VAGKMKVARFDTFEVLMFFAPILFLKTKKEVRQLSMTVVILAAVLTAQIVRNLEHPTIQILNGNDDITQIGASELLGFALLMCLYGELLKSSICKYIFSALFVFGVITCAARSTLVALLIGISVSAVAVRARTVMLSRKTIAIGLVLAFVITIPTFLWLRNVPAAQQKVRLKMAEVEALASGSTVKAGTINLRLSFYQSAIDAFKQHPIVGLGAGGWSIFYYGEDMLRYHPHNCVLEVAAELGIMGLSVLAVFLGILFRSALKLLRSDQYFAFLFPTLLFSVSYNVITGTVESRGLWFLCGFVAAAARISNQSAAMGMIEPRQARPTVAKYPKLQAGEGYSN
jgi:O-antigen ligase